MSRLREEFQKAFTNTSTDKYDEELSILADQQETQSSQIDQLRDQHDDNEKRLDAISEKLEKLKEQDSLMLNSHDTIKEKQKNIEKLHQQFILKKQKN